MNSKVYQSIAQGLVFCSAIFFFTSNASALTIDDFANTDQVASAVTGNTVNSEVASITAIGGFRKIRVSSAGGLAATDTSAVVDAASSLFGHSQDVGNKGTSLVRYDGGSGAANFNPVGLGGIDFTQDGSTGVKLSILSYDYPLSNSLTLTITLYDAGDNSGNTSSSATLTLNAAVNASTDFIIPYANFTINGIAGAADITNIGAVSLFINGGVTAAHDLTLDWFGTNGGCPQVPVVGTPVIDQCGVCGGNNSTCADCLGQPNGLAKIDKCGVCNGNNSSCCGDLDISDTQFVLDGGAKRHEKHLLSMLRRLRSVAPGADTEAYISDTAAKAHALQIRNWVLSWTMPSLILQCSNTSQCVQVANDNGNIISEYKVHSEELRLLGVEITNKIKAAIGGLTKADKRARKRNEKLHSTNIGLADTVPLVKSLCV